MTWLQTGWLVTRYRGTSEIWLTFFQGTAAVSVSLCRVLHITMMCRREDQSVQLGISSTYASAVTNGLVWCKSLAFGGAGNKVFRVSILGWSFEAGGVVGCASFTIRSTSSSFINIHQLAHDNGQECKGRVESSEENCR